MIDMKFTQGDDGVFDIEIENGVIKREDGFDTALNLSMLTYGRAPASRVVKPENRRGWLGNTVSPVIGRNIGSLMWLLNQRRLRQATLNEAISFSREALNWIVEDGLAQKIEVTGTIIPQTGIQLAITITALNGETETYYINLWELTGNAT